MTTTITPITTITQKTTASAQLLQEALNHIPGGVNSPVRSFNSVGGTPRFLVRGEGARVWDVDDHAYLDFVGSWGPLIVGHAHPKVVGAIADMAKKGLSFGAPTPIEVDFAKRLKTIMPDIQKVRLVSSGTEATMSAIRLARGFTGREGLVKFAGCYHGHSDSLLVQAGSGALTFGKPSSAGVPESVVQHSFVLPYNDCAGLEKLFAEKGHLVAAVIVEPVAGNMGMVMPKPEFLPLLRRLCTKYGAVLIVDEVMTGFRVALGGATAHYQIKPDLITLGKVIGGGMPVAAFGGLAQIMDKLSPLGDVYQAGTLSGNPVALSAGMATLDIITEPNFYENLTQSTKALIVGLQKVADEEGITFCSQSLGGMFGFYFAQKLPCNLADVQKSDVARFKKFFHGMLEQGVYFAPSAFEAGFVSAAHTMDDINEVIAKARIVMKTLK